MSARRPATEDRIALLLAKHGAELARHIRRIVRDDHATEDLLQDTLLRTHGALGLLRPGSNVRAWLYRIATNAALNHLRSRSREAAVLERHAREVDVTAPAWLGEDQPGAATGETDPRHTMVWARVAELPERQRVAFSLRASAACDYAEIAHRMGGTAAAARANVYQAMRTLRKEFR